MAESKKTDRSAWWLAAAGIVGAIAGAGITGGFNYLGQKKDLDAKLIELGIGILRADPTPGSEPLREWAIDVIEKRAQFEFTPDQKDILLKKPLPFLTGSAIGSAIPPSQ